MRSCVRLFTLSANPYNFVHVHKIPHEQNTWLWHHGFRKECVPQTWHPLGFCAFASAREVFDTVIYVTVTYAGSLLQVLWLKETTSNCLKGFLLCGFPVSNGLLVHLTCWVYLPQLFTQGAWPMPMALAWLASSYHTWLPCLWDCPQPYTAGSFCNKAVHCMAFLEPPCLCIRYASVSSHLLQWSVLASAYVPRHKFCLACGAAVFLQLVGSTRSATND